jgi:hypothetical protein
MIVPSTRLHTTRMAAHARLFPANGVAVEGFLPAVMVGNWVFDP